jgi:hypothetical protein
VTGPELEAALLRYFHADRLDAGERARLVAAGQEIVADPRRRGGQLGQFAPEDPVGHGLAWWEERQAGATDLVSPSDLDHALMLWTSEPRLAPLPAPRAHCPPDLVGRWELVGISPDDTTVVPPPAARTWILGRDGSLSTEGDPTRATWGWRVHEGASRTLCLGPAFDPLRERWRFVAPDETYAPPPAGNELDLVSPDATRGFDRWRRA